jgi:hypothetical protein
MDKIKSLITSRRFWMLIASVLVVAFKDKLPLDEEQITQVVLAIGAWIVGESLRSSEDIGRIVRSVLLVAMLSIASGSMAQAQIDLSYIKAKSLVGATAPRIIGDRIIIGEDSQPTVSVVAVITVKSGERYKIKARKTLFENAELVKLTDAEYMLAGDGEYLVEAVSVDSDATLKIVLGPSPEPTPEPKPDPPKPDPTPTPKPDVGNDYNVGAISIKTAPSDPVMARSIATWYRVGASKLFGQGGLADITTILKEIDASFAAKQCKDRATCEQWGRWKIAVSNALQAEQVRRKTYSRQDWYASLVEIAASLEAVK